MSSAWKEILMRPGDHLGPVPVLSPRLYVDPRRKEPPVNLEPSVGKFVGDGRDRVVLGWDDGLFASVFPYHYAREYVIRAANDWLIDRWLDRHPNAYGMMLISTAVPAVAAAEIRRVGAHDRIVAIALGCNGLGRPFGDNSYLPIYEAAAEMNLPVVVQVGSDTATDQICPPLAGGLPATYAEYLALGVHSHMSHASSMIIDGIFERFPNLKVLLVGGGFAWVPSWLWRLNFWFKRGRRSQAPWLTRLPSEYFLDNVRVSTFSLELPADVSRLNRVYESIPGLQQTLLYTSCYPLDSCETAADVVRRIPTSWQDAVLRENARGFFRWPDADNQASEAPGKSLAQSEAP